MTAIIVKFLLTHMKSIILVLSIAGGLGSVYYWGHAKPMKELTKKNGELKSEVERLKDIIAKAKKKVEGSNEDATDFENTWKTKKDILKDTNTTINNDSMEDSMEKDINATGTKINTDLGKHTTTI